MAGTFDTNIEMLCFSSISEAHKAATQVAALSAGVVIDVGSIRVEAQKVLYQGTMPRLMAINAFRNHITELTTIITTAQSSRCSFYTTWSSILCPANTLGYLSINNFGKVISSTNLKENDCETDTTDTILCSLAFDRVLFSLPQITYGASYCNYCGRVIPKKRIEAVPGTLRCTNCQDQ